jgi:hypothetical protein
LAVTQATGSHAVVQATASQVAAVADSTAVEAVASTVVAADTAKNDSLRKETAGNLPAVFFCTKALGLLVVEESWVAHISLLTCGYRKASG